MFTHNYHTKNLTAAYVCGFMFDYEKQNVVLILKNHPEWQKGKLNGLGGKVKEGESLEQAMAREFMEEAEVTTAPEKWEIFHEIETPEATIYFFKMQAHGIWQVGSPTSEQVKVYPIMSILSYPLPDTDLVIEHNQPAPIPNLRWLIGMCLDPAHKYSRSTLK